MAESEVPEEVEGPSAVDPERRNGLAGNDQGAVEEKARARENDGEVRKVEKIDGSPIFPINGSPEGEPGEGCPAERAREMSGGGFCGVRSGN